MVDSVDSFLFLLYCIHMSIVDYIVFGILVLAVIGGVVNSFMETSD